MRVLKATVEVTFFTPDEGTADELAEKYVDDVASTVFDLFGPEWFDPDQGWTLEGIVYLSGSGEASADEEGPLK